MLHESRGTELTDTQIDELKLFRDDAVDAWEKAIAATVIHYINDVLQDMGKFGTPDYSFANHAKHWGEMKGFALGLQFNPHSPVSDADFETILGVMGNAPVLSNDSESDINGYISGLLDARGMLMMSYEFDPANEGDNGGENGW